MTLSVAAGKSAHFVVWHPASKPLGKVESLESDPWLTVDALPDSTSARWCFRALATQSTGPASGAIRLKFSALEQPVVIDVRRQSPLPLPLTKDAEQ